MSADPVSHRGLVTAAMITIDRLSIPETLQEKVAPTRCALVVYDMQVGIVPFIQHRAAVVAAVAQLVTSARQNRVPVFFARHYSLPLKLAGIAQLRSALRFQRAAQVSELKDRLLQGSPEYQIIPELKPTSDDIVFDKIGMSFFVGTPLEFCLRDLQIDTLILTGCVAEIGIQPTLTHAIDLGFAPVAVKDACGSLSEGAHQRIFEDFSQKGAVADSLTIAAAWAR
jgi:nicotinamidase-related amidase